MKKPPYTTITRHDTELIAERDSLVGDLKKCENHLYQSRKEFADLVETASASRNELLAVANRFIGMCDIYFINGDFTKDTKIQVLELRAMALTAVSRVK